MSNPTASFVMGLLAPILPVGTPIQSVLIERGISPETDAFPVAVMTSPRTLQGMVDFVDAQDTYDILVLLLDRWEKTTITLEEISGNLRRVLEQMRANVNAHVGLPDVNGADQVFSAPLVMEIALAGPVEDEDLGFPVVSGTLLIRLKSLYYQIGG